VEENVIIRPFEPRDAEAFVRMGHWLQENSDFKDCGFDPRKVFELFVRVVENPDSMFGVFAELDGEIIGIFFGYAQEYYFSRKKMAGDMAFMLYPKYRHLSKDVLPRMFDLFEQWAKSVGAMEVVIGTSTMAHGKKLEPFANELGYKTVGFTAKKRFTD